MSIFAHICRLQSISGEGPGSGNLMLLVRFTARSRGSECLYTHFLHFETAQDPKSREWSRSQWAGSSRRPHPSKLIWRLSSGLSYSCSRAFHRKSGNSLISFSRRGFLSMEMFISRLEHLTFAFDKMHNFPLY